MLLQCLRWMVTFGDGPELYRRDSNPSSNRGWPIIRNVTHIHGLARLCKTHTYPVWGMTMLRQIRSTGPMRAPCFRGLSPGHFMLNVYWVLFLCVPSTLAAPCLTCYGATKTSRHSCFRSRRSSRTRLELRSMACTLRQTQRPCWQQCLPGTQLISAELCGSTITCCCADVGGYE